MNIPSHYQSAFFQALERRDDVDLRVGYFNGASQDRAAEGWKNDYAFKDYEFCVESGATPDALVESVADWNERIHIISGYFSSELIEWFCEQNATWCHWSEMPGIRLADLLHFRMPLFRLLNPLMLSCKRKEGLQIKNHALCAFGQGVLARRAFKQMGVPNEMISDLYYVPEGLESAEPSAQMVEFAKGRKIFLAVGALCRRKGIDVLLKAFALQKTEDWCVVFCGLDRASGVYQALARKLGIQEQVLFLGAYPVERIAEVYTAADVFVLPSRFDGWGAVLNEAASLGVPMIGTDLCGGAWHIIEEGQSGYRVRAGSVYSLAGSLRTYINNPALTKQHGRKALEIFQKNFTPDSNAVRLVAALNERGDK
ncbi:glycosyltransferase family 4 protein [Pontiellaceae bacterium B12227]|nr:glycosyltransferase family 4 protein [Pontiellaceae bacterium B12227]